ncbi:hypothetical protein BDK51DRAFT_39985 [Blyttiomyces helicus]|uniref:Uncharacterized protein n=1 Tax=Blyttiomyces helicus TaxID=388810 RepID=A0A4P9W2H0_9FUNG|nr:hypothetical protein BDK51DRAFT_39985 [Blyttiomyces helicus]|eukprot:RKO86421.1 hypothetical protein BDK51DRAFT_39985 [Blyttiomyces helicus]
MDTAPTSSRGNSWDLRAFFHVVIFTFEMDRWGTRGFVRLPLPSLPNPTTNITIANPPSPHSSRSNHIANVVVLESVPAVDGAPFRGGRGVEEDVAGPREAADHGHRAATLHLDRPAAYGDGGVNGSVDRKITSVRSQSSRDSYVLPPEPPSSPLDHKPNATTSEAPEPSAPPAVFLGLPGRAFLPPFHADRKFRSHALNAETVPSAPPATFLESSPSSSRNPKLSESSPSPFVSRHLL